MAKSKSVFFFNFSCNEINNKLLRNSSFEFLFYYRHDVQLVIAVIILAVLFYIII